ncbi:MAG TPA: CheR family methyltransferase [Candidatus Sulfotelmatobacter sp.]|nr:CheR family methyltransferase [Candidatus Sulfotelmatobacter sp.]
MHRLTAGRAILEHELSELRLLVERQTGVLLDCPNSALAAHVSEFLEKWELDSANALFDRLRSSEADPAVLQEFLSGVINTNTGFFRHPGAMGALAHHVLPQLYPRKSSEGPGSLRIWSVGCGTGEEAYSIAMTLCDPVSLCATTSRGQVNGNGNGNGNGGKSGAAKTGGIAENSLPSSFPMAKDWSVHIVGTDLLPSAVETAERGIYPQSALEGLPPAAIRSCFTKISCTSGVPGRNGSSETSSGGCHLLVKPRLRSMVTFNTMNLIEPVYIGRFDCIFCMDLLPHLSRPHRVALMERLHLYLEPGGYLFLSQTEKLCSSNLNFRAETFDGYTVYRKPLAASAAYGR